MQRASALGIDQRVMIQVWHMVDRDVSGHEAPQAGGARGPKATFRALRSPVPTAHRAAHPARHALRRGALLAAAFRQPASARPTVSRIPRAAAAAARRPFATHGRAAAGPGDAAAGTGAALQAFVTAARGAHPLIYFGNNNPIFFFNHIHGFKLMNFLFFFFN